MTQPKPVVPETRDFILDFTKGAPARQGQTSHAIDSKALQVFAAASVVVGLAAAGPLRHGTAAWIYAVALGAYLIAAVGAFWVLRTRDFRVVDDADQIWPDFYDVDLDTLKHALVTDVTSAYCENAELLASKARALKWLVGATAAEALLVGAAVMSSLV